MVKVACEELAFASLAKQVTVVAPIENVLPDAGLQLTMGLGSTLSAAVGEVYVAAAPDAEVASIV